MARKKKIWHGCNVFIASDYVEKPSFSLRVLIAIIKMILFPFVGWISRSNITGENVAMVQKGRVKGLSKKINTDMDLANALHNMWMKSKGHRENILNNNFTRLGIGVYRRRSEFYATELFYG